MLILAAMRRDMLAMIRDRLARGITDGDLTASPGSLGAIARYYHRGAGTVRASPGRRHTR